MEKVFLDQTIETLREDGLFRNANPEFALEIMAALPRPEFDGVKYIGGIGRWAVEGYIYMPRAREEIIKRVQQHLSEIRKWEKSHRNALATLLTERLSDKPANTNTNQQP